MQIARRILRPPSAQARVLKAPKVVRRTYDNPPIVYVVDSNGDYVVDSHGNYVIL